MAEFLALQNVGYASALMGGVDSILNPIEPNFFEGNAPHA
jgi:hypothetical protein